MKKLVIINGITGAVGSACLARFSREEGTVIYGISRKGFDYVKVLKNDLLPVNTNIFSIGNIADENMCKNFTQKINLNEFSEVIYIHAVGFYPFELDSKGNFCISNDSDGDGIDDRVKELSYKAFFAMSDSLANLDIPLQSFIFGSVSDKHMPEVHTSWWKTMSLLKEAAKSKLEKYKKLSINILNISSVICPHEILTRPFVFQNTNASASFWLMPSEVAEEVYILSKNSNKQNLYEVDLFHKSNYYDESYFEDVNFTERKRKELGLSN